MTLEMTYFRAELVQLIVNRSDSGLEVHLYGMKKKNPKFQIDYWSYHAALWMRQREKPSPNYRSVFENQTA